MSLITKCRLFDVDAKDCDINLESIRPDDLAESQLLWIDMTGATPDAVSRLGLQLGWKDNAAAAFHHPGMSPQLYNFGDTFFVRVVAVQHGGSLQFDGIVLSIMAGPNYVVTAHAEPIEFIEQLQKRGRSDSDIGTLSSDSFTASLLDWHLGSYFDAVSTFEAADERLEADIFDNQRSNCLQGLRDLRKAASRLRRMLSAHRAVFAGLARPDFRPTADSEANQHFLTIGGNFHRAMDAVENTRDIVIGSFELFSNQTALRTNEIIRILTFVTVLIGVLAVIAGVLGMNFEAPFFRTGVRGFLVAVTAMLVFAIAGLLIARWRRWM